MFNRLNKKTYDNSSIRATDKSVVISEQVKVFYNTDSKEYEVLISNTPRGSIISLVIFDTDGDVIVDGVINVVGNVVKFLKDTDSTFNGKLAEIKYLTESLI